MIVFFVHARHYHLPYILVEAEDAAQVHDWVKASGYASGAFAVRPARPDHLNGRYRFKASDPTPASWPWEKE